MSQQHGSAAWLQQHGSIRSIYISAGVDSDTAYPITDASALPASGRVVPPRLSPTDMSKGGGGGSSRRDSSTRMDAPEEVRLAIFSGSKMSASRVLATRDSCDCQHSTQAHPYTSRPLTSSHRYCLICCWSSFCSDVSVRDDQSEQDLKP
jgi:hypothetical protein